MGELVRDRIDRGTALEQQREIKERLRGYHLELRKLNESTPKVTVRDLALSALGRGSAVKEPSLAERAAIEDKRERLLGVITGLADLWVEAAGKRIDEQIAELQVKRTKALADQAQAGEEFERLRPTYEALRERAMGNVAVGFDMSLRHLADQQERFRDGRLTDVTTQRAALISGEEFAEEAD